MIKHFIGRCAALLTVALLAATFTTVQGQTTTPIAKFMANQLLTSGDAAVLRTHLLDKLQGKIDPAAGTSEKTTLSVGGNSVTCEVVSQFITLKNERVEQISINTIQDGTSNTINLVQYANGDLGRLEGGNLVAYSLASRGRECLDELFSSNPNCTICKNKVNNCINRNTRVSRIALCLASNFDGSCISCGLTLTQILTCILLF